MSETTKTLPALFAVLVGITCMLMTGNLFGLVMFCGIGVGQYLLRNQPLHAVSRFLFILAAGAFGTLTLFALSRGIYQAVPLSVLLTALCTSVLYIRMKV